MKAALPGLLSAFAERGDLPSTLWSEFGGPGIAMLAEMLNQAVVMPTRCGTLRRRCCSSSAARWY